MYTYYASKERSNRQPVCQVSSPPLAAAGRAATSRTMRWSTPLCLTAAVSFLACGDNSSPNTASESAGAETPANAPEETAPAEPRGAAPSHQEAPEPAAFGPESVAGIKWSAPDAFTRVTPGSRMRIAEYRIGEGDAAATMTVFFFGAGMGGSVDENVERWVNQFAQPDGSSPMDAADVDREEVHGLQVTTVTVAGTFTQSPMMGGDGRPREGMRLLGAIVTGGDGPVFFKLVGPAATVEGSEGAFEELVATFEAD